MSQLVGKQPTPIHHPSSAATAAVGSSPAKPLPSASQQLHAAQPYLNRPPTASAAPQAMSSSVSGSGSGSTYSASSSGSSSIGGTGSLSSSTASIKSMISGANGTSGGGAGSTSGTNSTHGSISGASASTNEKDNHKSSSISSISGGSPNPNSSGGATAASGTAAAASSGQPSGTGTGVAPALSPAEALKAINDKIPNDVRELREHFASIPRLTVKHFSLAATLGTGTFGRVRLVNYTHQQKQHWFALKMLKKTEIIRLKQVDHIKAEKAILCRITHPFIVNLYAHFQDERNLFMCMEYVIGGELFSQLRKVGRFHNDVSRFYAAEIILALEYLHDRNIVYRDLKPENLLIDREGHMKITDFGFAKLVEDRTWTLCGTPEYLAPEIIQSKGHGKAVDWWALGILIYEMLAGYPPFYDENPFGIYQKILAGKIEFPRHFDPNAKDLVKKLLQADRTKRFGCLKNGADDIKKHKWFKDLNWTDCVRRALKPPFIPAYTAPNDTSNFDKYPDSDTDKTPASTAAAVAATAAAVLAASGGKGDIFADF